MDRKGKKFKKFFESLENAGYTLEIFNLNYDTWVEQSLKKYKDGYTTFENCKGIKRFSFEGFFKEENINTVAHPHGQICFEYLNMWKVDIAKINKEYAYRENQNSLYKYDKYEVAKATRSSYKHSNAYSQAGETIFRTNIITGLMKTDKLLWNPMAAYHTAMSNALLENKRLIIIGYGFSDLYINSLLLQQNEMHFEERRILLIDKADSEEWDDFLFQGHEKNEYTARMFKQDGWFRTYKRKQNKGFLRSEDGMAVVCGEGFYDVIDNHMAEVLEFMN